MPRLCSCPAGFFIAVLLDDITIVDLKLVDDREFEELCSFIDVGLEWIRTDWGIHSDYSALMAGSFESFNQLR
jgi:hypothetical protein